MFKKEDLGWIHRKHKSCEDHIVHINYRGKYTATIRYYYYSLKTKRTIWIAITPFDLLAVPFKEKFPEMIKREDSEKDLEECKAFVLETFNQF